LYSDTKKEKREHIQYKETNFNCKYIQYVYACICFPAAPAFYKYRHSLPYTSYKLYSPEKNGAQPPRRGGGLMIRYTAKEQS
jgi:hypothetical protein